MTDAGFLYFLSGGNVYRATYNGSEVKKINSDGGVRPPVLPVAAQPLTLKWQNVPHETRKRKCFSCNFQANYIRETLAQRTAALHQFWKTYHHRFYDHNFHGRDWSALRDKYLQRLSSVDTNDEFAHSCK